MEYKSESDTMTQKVQEIKLAKIEAKVLNERAKGQENAVDVELKRAKTAVEMAKARMTASESDLRDLDFLEREQGIPHQREMEKQAQKDQAAMNKQELQEAARLAGIRKKIGA